MVQSWNKDARQTNFWRIIEVSDTESRRGADGDAGLLGRFPA